MKRPLNIIVLLLCSLLVYGSSTDKLRLLSLLRQTDFYITSGNFLKAEDLCNQALVLFKELGAENDIAAIMELRKVSHAYSEKGMYSEAIKTESLLVEIFPLVQPNNIKDYALYLNDLAFYSMGAKDYERGEECVNKAIEILKGVDNRETLAEVYIRTAEILSESDSTKIEMAISYQLKAIAIYEDIYGKESNKTLGEVQYLVGYYEKAKKFQEACFYAKDIWNKKNKKTGRRP